MREMANGGTYEFNRGQKAFTFIIVILIFFTGFIGFIIFEVEPVSAPGTSSRGNKILYVGGIGTGNYTSIEAAIDDAIDGDSVFVYKGKYEEQIIINKQISLISEGINITNIYINSGGEIIKVTASNVIISGFTITKTDNYYYPYDDAGINLEYAHNCNIINNVINFRSVSLILNW